MLFSEVLFYNMFFSSVVVVFGVVVVTVVTVVVFPVVCGDSDALRHTADLINTRSFTQLFINFLHLKIETRVQRERAAAILPVASLILCVCMCMCVRVRSVVP